MPKAILELDMPESCKTCPCCHKEKMYCEVLLLQTGIVYSCLRESRRSDCPLKLVDVDALEKQKPKKIVLMENTNKFKNPYGHHPAYGHCPVCGRIYWDKCHVGNYCDQCGQRLEAEKE